MWVCGYVYMWVCGHVGMCTCGYVYMRVCVHVGTCTCGHVGTCTCGYVGTCTCRYVGTWVSVQQNCSSVEIKMLVIACPPPHTYVTMRNMARNEWYLQWGGGVVR